MALPRTIEVTLMRATKGPDSSPSPRPRYTPGAAERRFSRSVTAHTVIGPRESPVSHGPSQDGRARFALARYGEPSPSDRCAQLIILCRFAEVIHLGSPRVKGAAMIPGSD